MLHQLVYFLLTFFANEFDRSDKRQFSCQIFGKYVQNEQSYAKTFTSLKTCFKEKNEIQRLKILFYVSEHILLAECGSSEAVHFSAYRKPSVLYSNRLVSHSEYQRDNMKQECIAILCWTYEI